MVGYQQEASKMLEECCQEMKAANLLKISASAGDTGNNLAADGDSADRPNRSLDPLGILYRPPLDPSAGVCHVKRKVKSSIPPGGELFTLLI